MVRIVLAWAAFIIGPAAFAQGIGFPMPDLVQAKALAKLPDDLRAHLIAWEKRSQKVQTFSTDFERDITNRASQKTAKYTGSFRCMKPNLAYIRIDSTDKKDDYSTYIINEKKMFEYSGSDKTVTEHERKSFWSTCVRESIAFKIVNGSITAAEFALDYDLKLLKEDQFYVYIEANPILNRWQMENDKLICVFFKDNGNDMAYLLAKLRMTRNNDQEIEEWTLKQPMVNPKGIKESDFKFVEPPEGWKTRKSGSLFDKTIP
jgi:TIGR03009 family protein